MTPTPNPFNHLDIGRHAEHDARKYLEARGLQFLQQNFQCKTGEIDLIMLDNDTIVFVEVRHRTNPLHGNALESITPAKIKKIIKTALYYLQQKKWLYTAPCRFDIIAIHPVSGKMKLEWLRNAFTLDS